MAGDPSDPESPHDDEERSVRMMADELRRGLRDPATRRNLTRLAKAAMGDEPGTEDDGSDAPDRPFARP